MQKKIRLIALTLLTLLITQSFSQTNVINTPESVFGFKPGTDRELIDYGELTDYLLYLDEVSPRIEMRNIGESPNGLPMYICFISDPENIQKLDNLKEINRQLALNADLSDTEQQMLVKEGRVFFLATLSMHSTEVGPSQSAPLIAYDMATTNDSEMLSWMKDVVYMFTPSHNPDGMDMIVEHWRKYKDTKYEGSSMPGVYHKYVGHDNNRDFITLSQKDTKVVAEIYNTSWLPQVMVEKHQMGSRGVRYFVPPPHDPIAENIDAAVWNWVGIFGSNMMTDMTAAGLDGIAQHYLFDEYWPGSTETSLWKNVIGFLTEAASVQTAKPIYIEPTELNVWGKGLSEYKKSINMPKPWEGGWWRLGDIIEYEIQSTYSVIKTCSYHKKEILQFRNDICKSEVVKGKTEAPYYYIMPKKQRDQGEMVGIANLMIEHGVEIYELGEDFMLNNQLIEKGSIVIPLAQAYRPFIKEVMEKQKFPVRHYTPNGEIIKPYDITSWSLPLHRGVECIEVNEKVEINNLQLIINNYLPEVTIEEEYNYVALSASENESFLLAIKALNEGIKVERTQKETEVLGQKILAGSFIMEKSKSVDALLNDLNSQPVFLTNKPETENIILPRIALVETNMHDMDAGWTRFIFDSYEIPFSILKPEDFEKADLEKDYDVIIFPGARKSLLKDGKYSSGGEVYTTSYPPEFTKGMGKKGFEKLMQFFVNGGKIISWGGSTELFTSGLSVTIDDEKEEFRLPVRDDSKSLKSKGLYVPGAFVRIKLKQDHPLTWGMQDETGVFYRGSPVFSTSQPRFDMDRRVIGWFPEEDILLSGYIEKQKTLGRKAAMVWVKKDKGQMVLFAFYPQFRASTQGTYKLLFNALFL